MRSLSFESAVKVVLALFLFFVTSLFFARKVNLTTADLGRHIKNGEEFVQTLKPVRTNHYSYTQPNYPVVNHHWGSGVIFYLTWLYFSFNGLSVLYVSLSVLTLLFFFFAAKKASNYYLAFFLSVLALPLFAARTEIRPEVFSYLFLGIYFYMFYLHRRGEIPFKYLLFLLPLQVLWVNLHIFFVLGIFLAGTFALDAILTRRNRVIIVKFLLLTFLMVVSGLLNPFGLNGLLEPFTIFREYGYMLVENQTLFFMQKRFSKAEYVYFEFMFVFALESFVFLLIDRKVKEGFWKVVLILFFGVLSFRAVRGFPMFGLFFVPVVAENLHEGLWNRLSRRRGLVDKFLLYGSVGVLVLGLIVGKGLFSPIHLRLGIGLMENINDSAEFFKENDLKGPIFNNYDIGGYLIFNFYPQEKVFVDNRPEAYTVSFFKDKYIPMQENEEIWTRAEEEYGFNVVYFFRRDLTPWAQPFLIERVEDPSWVPVYVDDFVLILVKDNQINREVIEKFELPKENFVVT